MSVEIKTRRRTYAGRGTKQCEGEVLANTAPVSQNQLGYTDYVWTVTGRLALKLSDLLQTEKSAISKWSCVPHMTTLRVICWFARERFSALMLLVMLWGGHLAREKSRTNICLNFIWRPRVTWRIIVWL